VVLLLVDVSNVTVYTAESTKAETVAFGRAALRLRGVDTAGGVIEVAVSMRSSDSSF